MKSSAIKVEAVELVSIDLQPNEWELLEHIQKENDTDIQKIVHFCLREFLHTYQKYGVVYSSDLLQT